MKISTRFMKISLAASFYLPLSAALATTADVTTTAAQLGLTPEALVVADLQSMASTILSRLEAATGQRTALQEKRQVVDAASAIVSQLTMAIQLNPDDSTLNIDFQTAASQLQTLNTQMVSAIESLRLRALDGASAIQLQRLANWRSSGEVRAPLEFRATARSAPDWESIELALRAERRAGIRGETLDAAFQSLLETVRNEDETSAAAQRLASHLSTVESFFEQYDQP